MMIGKSLARSAYGYLIAEIKFVTVEREFIPIKIKDEQNKVADQLASYSRLEIALQYGYTEDHRGASAID